jgi:hypothetical protein
MYSIFHPLDPNERLPRELLLAGRRHRWFDDSRVLWIIGFAYMPVLILGVIVMGSLHLNEALELAVICLAFVGLLVFVSRANRV